MTPPEPSPSPSGLTLAAFIGAVILGGANFLVVRISNRELPPIWGAGLRFTLAAALFVLIALALRLRWPRGRQLWLTSLYGFLSFAVSYALGLLGACQIDRGGDHRGARHRASVDAAAGSGTSARAPPLAGRGRLIVSDRRSGVDVRRAAGSGPSIRSPTGGFRCRRQHRRERDLGKAGVGQPSCGRQRGRNDDRRRRSCWVCRLWWASNGRYPASRPLCGPWSTW